MGRARFVILIATASLVGSCGSRDEGGFEQAKELIRRGVAKDVSLTFQDNTLKRYERGSAGYNVCGDVIVDQPGLIEHQLQSFIIPISSDGSGVATFADEPVADPEFKAMQERFCR